MPLWKYFFFVFSFWNFANVFGMVFFRFIIFEKNLFLSFDKFGTFAVIISLSTFSVQPSFFSLSESDDTNIRYFVIVSQVPESQFIFFFQSFFFSFRLDISFFFSFQLTESFLCSLYSAVEPIFWVFKNCSYFFFSSKISTWSFFISSLFLWWNFLYFHLFQLFLVAHWSTFMITGLKIFVRSC